MHQHLFLATLILSTNDCFVYGSIFHHNQHSQPERDLQVGFPCNTPADCSGTCNLQAEGECFYPSSDTTAIVTCSESCGPGVDITIYCAPTCIPPSLFTGYAGVCSQSSTAEVNGCVGLMAGTTVQDWCNPIGCPPLSSNSGESSTTTGNNVMTDVSGGNNENNNKSGSVNLQQSLGFSWVNFIGVTIFMLVSSLSL